MAKGRGKPGPDIDAPRLFMEAGRFARAAYSLSTKLTDVPDTDEHFEVALTTPSIVRTEGKTSIYFHGSQKARQVARHDLVGSYVVLAALSLELYLKCLIFVDREIVATKKT